MLWSDVCYTSLGANCADGDDVVAAQYQHLVKETVDGE